MLLGGTAIALHSIEELTVEYWNIKYRECMEFRGCKGSTFAKSMFANSKKTKSEARVT